MDFEASVKQTVYDTVAASGRMPDAPDVARRLGADVESVLTAFQALHRKRLLVPEPGDPGRIRMAPPFSGVPTTFRVEAKGVSYDANCVWDGLGVLAALHEDGVVLTEDGHTREPLVMRVEGGRAPREPVVAHFAVPAARWWADVIHT